MNPCSNPECKETFEPDLKRNNKQIYCSPKCLRAVQKKNKIEAAEKELTDGIFHHQKLKTI